MSEATVALVEKRRELVARRREIKAELTKLARDIGALDRVLAMLEPGYQPEVGRANRPRGAFGPAPFGPGEMTSAALSALRELGRPATTSECADAMLVAKGLLPDETVRAGLASKVATVFAQKARAGKLSRVGNDDGRKVLWQIQH